MHDMDIYIRIRVLGEIVNAKECKAMPTIQQNERVKKKIDMVTTFSCCYQRHMVHRSDQPMRWQRTERKSVVFVGQTNITSMYRKSSEICEKVIL